MAQEKYITKQDVANKGMSKKDGIFYKKSLLEIWYSKGWLDLPNSKYGADDRLRCGMALALDYHIIERTNLHSGHSFNTKIDISDSAESRGLLDAKDRYNKAIRAVPAEFWPVVRQICIEEREIAAPAEMSERQKTYFYYLNRIDLCRGLDRIIASRSSHLKSENTKRL